MIFSSGSGRFDWTCGRRREAGRCRARDALMPTCERPCRPCARLVASRCGGHPRLRSVHFLVLSARPMQKLKKRSVAESHAARPPFGHGSNKWAEHWIGPEPQKGRMHRWALFALSESSLISSSDVPSKPDRSAPPSTSSPSLSRAHGGMASLHSDMAPPGAAMPSASACEHVTCFFVVGLYITAVLSGRALRGRKVERMEHMERQRSCRLAEPIKASVTYTTQSSHQLDTCF
jgi:hypothetical protein